MAVGETTRAREPAPPSGSPDRQPSRWRALLAACLALAALSLLAPHSPTYDPWAWLIWGRQIAHGSLDTVAGPSWKPLPVLFTTVFALLGGVAPVLWVAVARAGGLLAVALAFRLARRLAGPVAGVVAVAGLLLATDFVANVAWGDSEGILVALSLWAVERHLDGRPRDAFAFGVAAALLRPEVWPFVGLYGLWLVWADRHGARPARTLALVVAAGVAILLLWFVPELVGSGDLLRGAARAREPVAGSPGQAARPFLAVLDTFRAALVRPVRVGALLVLATALLARRHVRHPTARLALVAVVAAYLVTVAVLAQGGFTGNVRYLTLPAALVCVLAGVGFADVLAAVGRRAGRPVAALAGTVALAVSAPYVADGVSALGLQLRPVRDAALLADELPVAMRRAGGARALARCHVYASPYNTQLIAWHLRLHAVQVGIEPQPPGTVFAARVVELPGDAVLARDARFPLAATTPRWVIRSSCAG